MPKFVTAKPTTTSITTRESLAMNGMVEVAMPCGGCSGCKTRTGCMKPWRGVKLPDNPCTFCGHFKHTDECPGCPCAKRWWGMTPPAPLRLGVLAVAPGDEGDGAPPKIGP